MSTSRSYGRDAVLGPRPDPAQRRAAPLPEAARAGVARALRSLFNILALNLALVVASLPVVTVPVAFNAATIALERWRAQGEDRVVREFLSALRSSPPGRTTLRTGAPFVAIAIALEEVHFFARGGSALNCVCLGFGAAALAVALTSVGYVLVLGARYPDLPVPEVWSLSVSAALHNLLVSGPIAALALAGVVLLGLLDPALGLLGLPLGFVFLVTWAAEIGARRSGLTAETHKAQ